MGSTMIFLHMLAGQSPNWLDMWRFGNSPDVSSEQVNFTKFKQEKLQSAAPQLKDGL